MQGGPGEGGARNHPGIPANSRPDAQWLLPLTSSLLPRRPAHEPHTRTASLSRPSLALPAPPPTTRPFPLPGPQAYPRLRATVVDLPHVVAAAQRHFAPPRVADRPAHKQVAAATAAGGAPLTSPPAPSAAPQGEGGAEGEAVGDGAPSAGARLSWLAADMWAQPELLPAGADAYVLSRILHDWEEDRCVMTHEPRVRNHISPSQWNTTRAGKKRGELAISTSGGSPYAHAAWRTLHTTTRTGSDACTPRPPWRRPGPAAHGRSTLTRAGGGTVCRCRQVLALVHSKLAPGGVVLVCEMLLDPDGLGPLPALLQVGGCCCSKKSGGPHAPIRPQGKGRGEEGRQWQGWAFFVIDGGGGASGAYLRG